MKSRLAIINNEVIKKHYGHYQFYIDMLYKIYPLRTVVVRVEPATFKSAIQDEIYITQDEYKIRFFEDELEFIGDAE